MTDPGAPRRGRHSGDATADRTLDRHLDRYADRAAARYAAFGAGERHAAAASQRAAGLLDRPVDETGPLVESMHPVTASRGGVEWWPRAQGSPDRGVPLDAGPSTGEGGPMVAPEPPEQPARPGPTPLPPRPTGVWDRLQRRSDAQDADPDATVATPVGAGPPRPDARPPAADPTPVADEPPAVDEGVTDAHPLDWDRTGGLEVIGAHVDDEHPHDDDILPAGHADDDHHASAADEHPYDEHDEHLHDDHLHDEHLHDEDIPVVPYDPREGRRRRRRRPLAAVLSLLVLAGLVAGIFVGGQRLLDMVPVAQDYEGPGTGAVEIRVQDGDTLSDIARTLVAADVVASSGPFIDAAEESPEATSIQPGVYGMRLKMSGQAALDHLLDPATRLTTRIPVPEGLTVEATLARIAEISGIPAAELQAAAADPAALGLPAYAQGRLEGFLFPATYDVEPGTPAADVLRMMIARGTQALDALQIPEDQRLTALTKASIVQAEAGNAEDMGKVARVVENRLADGMRLQMDSTVNYATGKGGITTTAEDRASESPYNTYRHAGLPPGPINNPGEDALKAVLSPTPGDWRFFVEVDPHAGDTRFAVTAEEHQQNVLLFRQWLQENPGG